MKYILSHDLGTSGNKASVFDQDGALVDSEVHSYGARYFNETWVEQEPGDWWDAVCVSTQKLIRRSGIDAADIAVVSFSGQMLGCLCVDRKGNPLRNSIIWADHRAQAQTDALLEKMPMAEQYQITGHRGAASYGLQKLMWVRDNQPDIYKNTHKALNAKDYILFKLTGVFMTEPTDASSFGCMDLRTNRWSDKIVQASGVDESKLPDIMPSTHVAGYVTKEAARATGLKADTPVVLGGGDGVCANVGAGSVKPGKTYCSLGSSSWVATTSEQPVLDEHMRTMCWPHIVPGYYSPNGTMQTGGGAYSWLKTNVCKWETEQAAHQGISPYQLINQEIEGSPPGANGVLFLPYLLGERAPRWDPLARASFLGVKMENTRGDLLRSVLEGITMNLALILRILQQHTPIGEVLVIGGGAKGAVWSQIIADIFGVPAQVPRVLEEATSMGAAITGGVGVGLFKDFGIVDQMIQIVQTYPPRPETRPVYDRSMRLFDQAYHALGDLHAAMADKA
ncbi:MAG: xylulokinase [Clostridiales bacterium]|nr:xylulokinase [Clostridiales bacterium]